MDIDNYINSLQNELDERLNRFGLGANESEAKQLSNDIDSASVDVCFCPECGTKVTGGDMFCPNCGSKLNEDECEDGGATKSNHSGENVGIIFTDTGILAQKYSVSRDAVNHVLQGFRTTASQHGQMWHMLDMRDYQNELGDGTWMDYSDVLQRFINGNHLKPGPELSLFIIGGNDVIPQPAEANPCFEPSPWSDDSYQDTVYADLYYCFYGKLPLDFLDYNKARCNVARLPLETGKLSSSLEEDLQAYFNLSNMVTAEGGIPIGRAVMTSNYDWIPASREMSRNLPVEQLDDEEGATLDNMYISPNIMADMDKSLEKAYTESLSNADMLVFNLHGACDPGMSGFYSSGEAFSIDMLKKSNARIFNTVACWGGRYIKYSRKQSMLLSAIYANGVLLYCGACVPAMGKCGDFRQDETWAIQPAAYSETFMARFAQYQCLGKLTAGEALLKAKCDYYNSSRMIEEDQLILATVLMFNLYGNPMLKTVPDVEAIADIQSDDGSKMIHKPYQPTQKKAVWRADKNREHSSLLDKIRGLVNTNLEGIHQVMTKKLYEQLGLEPRQMYGIDQYTRKLANGTSETGYIYQYAKDKDYTKSTVSVRVDSQGNVLDAIQTK